MFLLQLPNLSQEIVTAHARGGDMVSRNHVARNSCLALRPFATRSCVRPFVATRSLDSADQQQAWRLSGKSFRSAMDAWRDGAARVLNRNAPKIEEAERKRLGFRNGAVV